MSDSDTTQHNPDGDADGVSVPSAGQPVNGAHEPSVPEPSSSAPQRSTGAPPQSASKQGAQPVGRKSLWAFLAAICIAAGVVGTVLGAHALARSDAAKARRSFQVSSTGIASALKLSIQRQEELAVSASTFFASNPDASPAEFNRWVKWARTKRRYPELENLGLITLVRAPELAAFQARLSGRPLPSPTARPLAGSPVARPPAAHPSTSLASTLRIVPASDHHYYCLAVAELARSVAASSPAGQDYCALNAGLLLSRDTGRGNFALVSVGASKGLAFETPVYRGNVTPHSLVGRMAASVGWLRDTLAPGAMLQQALRGYPDNAVDLAYRSGSSSVVFTDGRPQAGAQSSTSSLHNGWTVTSFAATASAGVLADGHAVALLIGGILLSVLLGALIFLLGAGVPRPRALAAASGPKSASGEPANAELYDALTGLPNRALTLDRAECMVARAGRQSGMLAGALFIDIDWLKDVNDKLGQAAGDHLLKIVAERLEGVVRGGDTVGRLGGDEFVLLVESAARSVRLDSLARRVIEGLHKPVELEDFGPNFFFTASIGVAFGRYTTPEDLLRDAQLALYAAKAAGKDRYTLFNANMRSVIESRSVLEDELNSAIQEKQLFLLYQPIYDLTSQKVAGLEALIRWQHPKQGVLEPSDFMPLAEETGLIVPIGRWALEEACTRAAAWNVSGRHRVGISIKVSANQVNRDGFATDVRRALQQSGIEPSLLTLEIAETTVMRDLTAAADRLREIKQLGVRVAIDDFGGSGYARHSDLQRMPLDFLKVDRGALAASEGEDYRSWLLEAILIVGRDLQLTVIATEIDTYEQMSALQAIGCTMAQGMFLGKPTPTDEVEGLFHIGLPAPAADSTRHFR